MKAFFHTAIALATLLIYVSCQKEIANTLPAGTTGQDSTATGTDSTINENNDSLAVISFSPDSGATGTEVRIVGINFDTIASGNKVSINTTSATVISATKTTLTIQVLEGTENGKISVTAKGKTATSLNDFIVIVDSAVSGTNVWTRKADFPPGSDIFLNGFSIGGKGYLFYGSALWQFDPGTNKWNQKKSLPSDTWHRFGFCFVIGNKAYVGLGANREGEVFTDEYNQDHFNYNEVWSYDAAQDAWTQKKDFPGSPRVMPFSFAVGGNGYIGGGDSTNYNFGSVKDFWKYNAAADSWTRLTDFPGVNSLGFSGFSLGGAGYVLEAGPGNPTAPISAGYSDKLWKYNIAANSWEQKANLPTSNFVSAVTFTINGKAYAALGVMFDTSNPPAEKADFWAYDPALNKWAKKADVGGGLRWLSSGFAIGNKGYAGLGTGDTEDDQKNDFWEYTPE